MNTRILSILCLLCWAPGLLLVQKESHRLHPFIGGGVQISTLTFPNKYWYMKQLAFDASTGYIIKGGTDLAFRKKLKNAFLRWSLVITLRTTTPRHARVPSGISTVS